MLEIVEYITAQGKYVWREWVKSLRDDNAAIRISKRVQRLKQGNFGDCKPVGGGIWESN